MNAQTQVAAMTTEYAASKGIGLTYKALRIRADLVEDCCLGADEYVTAFFTDAQTVFDAGEDGYEYGPGDLTFIGAYMENPETGDGFCLGREDAITRWGESAIYECEQYFDGRNQ